MPRAAKKPPVEGEVADAPAAKSPRKRAAKKADETEGTVTDIHAAGERGLASEHDGEAPAIVQHKVSAVADAGGIVREAPDADAAEAAAREEPETHYSAVVARVMRFAAKKETAWVRLLPTVVQCGGSRGSVHIPWTAPGIPDEGVVVDGRTLCRLLRAAGSAPKFSFSGGKLIITFGARRFTLATQPDQGVMQLLYPPREGVTWSWVKPDVVKIVGAFAAPDTCDPPTLSGVHLAKGAAMACDKRGLVRAFGAIDDENVTVTLPRDAFAGMSAAPDGETRCAFALDAQGHAVIGDPRTGEYRVFVTWGSEFPDVAMVLDRVTAAFHVDVEKAAFVSALKQIRLVQSAGSSVKFWVWDVPSSSEHAGQWLEMRAGDGARLSEFVARFAVAIHGSGPVPGGAAVRLCVAGDELLRLAAATPGEIVRLGFGASDRDPLSSKMHDVEDGLPDRAIQVALMPMMEPE